MSPSDGLPIQTCFEHQGLRIQALSSSLVRLERRGPKGYEDRPSFRILERSWPGVPLRRELQGGQTLLRGEQWSLWLPEDGNPESVRITDPAGALLFAWDGNRSSARELPAPGAFPRAWALADTPRLIPPPWGATPAPQGDPDLETSGWDLDNDALDLYVFLPRGDYARLRADLVRLTGPTELPPLFLFGLWHSRYYPYRDSGALSVIREYRERGFPLDVFMLDTHWRVSASYGYEVNTRLFPDFTRFLDEAHRLGVRLGINDHPRAITASALDPREMAYRYANLARFLWLGVDFWWFDRNWDVCLKGPHPLICKEVWGMRVFTDMTRRAVPERRPLILANVDGIDDGHPQGPADLASHRFAFQWTGDTRLEWSALRRGLANALHASVHSLIPYVSEDVGCHEGMPSAEFYLRHWQYACLSAVLRPHASNSRYFLREPWSFGPQVEGLALEYARMRYRLLPYLYAAARRNFDQGDPLLARLDLEHPEAPEAAREDQYLLGGQLLVAPILEGEPLNPLVPAAWLRGTDGFPGVEVTLYPNENLLGPPLDRWREAQVNADWDHTPPGRPEAPPYASARWSGILTPARPVQVGMRMEEGGRLFLDGQLVFDHWTQDQWLHSTSNHGLHLMTLEPGRPYALQVESRHCPGARRCQLFFRPMDLPEIPRTRGVWLPPGEWIDLWSGNRHQGPLNLQVSAGPASIPLFTRSGALLPLAPEMRHSDEIPWDPVTLDIYPTRARPSQAELYEDDHWSNGHLKGMFRRTRIQAELDPEMEHLTIRISPAQGRFRGAPLLRTWVLRIHLPPDWKSAESPEGHPCRLHPPDPSGMPFADRGASPDGPVLEVRLPPGPIGEARTVSLRRSLGVAP